MLELIQVLLLAITQGLTEFLPVSSSGHLVLLQQWFGGQDGDLFLDVILHCGTLGSVVFVYRREIGRPLRCDRPALRYMGSLALATVPAVVTGGLLRGRITALFHDSSFAAVGLLVTAAILFTTRFRMTERDGNDEPWQPRPVAPLRALLIGLAQSLAIAPGISRSGATIAASLWTGLPRAEAARFSFLLSVPAICGALVLEVCSGEFTTRGGLVGPVIAVVGSFVVGLLALKWTARAVLQHHFWKFGFYCLPLGVLVLVLLR